MNEGLKISGAAVIGFLLGILVMFGYQQMQAQTTTVNETVQPPLGATPVTTETPTPAPLWTANLLEQNKSGESGTVTLTDENGKTKVVISLTVAPGASVSALQPAHIHVGTCPTPGAVRYGLNSVINGKSETLIATSVASLKASLPLAVNVHKSASEIKIYTACGDLK